MNDRLPLPTVTLIGMDAIDPIRTLRVLADASHKIDFAEVVMITDLAVHAQSKSSPAARATRNLHWIHRPQPRDWIHLHHMNFGVSPSYQWDILTFLPLCFSTAHCLYMEWDSGVMDARKWKEYFLDYDFVGAPWPYPQKQQGYPAITAENCVGNNGFSLHSLRFCQAVARLADHRDQAYIVCDAYMCRTHRERLIREGLKFAPENIAKQFSCEGLPYDKQFGMHGRGTIDINHFNWPPPLPKAEP